MTLLNYVATWSAVIDQDRRGACVDMARLLLRHGADLERDDRQDEWFMPLHNAVRSGAADLADLMLETKPEAIHLGTADARMPLHVLPLCDLAEDRTTTLEVLLRPRQSGGETVTPQLNFQEFFYGNTPMHIAAKEGQTEVVVELIQVGASPNIKNFAGRTPIEEARAVLDALENDSTRAHSTAIRRSRIAETVSAMEIALIVT